MGDENESMRHVDTSRERIDSENEEEDDGWEEHVAAQWFYPTTVWR